MLLCLVILLSALVTLEYKAVFLKSLGYLVNILVAIKRIPLSITYDTRVVFWMPSGYFISVSVKHNKYFHTGPSFVYPYLSRDNKKLVCNNI